MSELDWLAGRFEENRPRLRSMALRMLGSASEADDAVQEAWLRVSRADADAVENLAGWLTTITARVCLNMLQSRRARPEEPAGTHPPRASSRRVPAWTGSRGPGAASRLGGPGAAGRP